MKDEGRGKYSRNFIRNKRNTYVNTSLLLEKEETVKCDTSLNKCVSVVYMRLNHSNGTRDMCYSCVFSHNFIGLSGLHAGSYSDDTPTLPTLKLLSCFSLSIYKYFVLYIRTFRIISGIFLENSTAVSTNMCLFNKRCHIHFLPTI